MQKNIADDNSIVMAVREVMKTRPRIDSQRGFVNAVLSKLDSISPGARASPVRIRKAAVLSGSVRLEILYRESERPDLPEICPVCGSAMVSVRNRTLESQVAELKRNCSVCAYSTGTDVLVPARYTFVRCHVKEVSDKEERIRKLKKARSLLKQASKLISEALDGSDIPTRQKPSREMIDEIVSSKEMAGSIPNLIADLDEKQDPLWTKPLSTPKYPDRKGI